MTEKLTPVEKARRREKRIVEGLHNLAERSGKTLFPIHGIDANGEILFAVQSEGSEKQSSPIAYKNEVCGEFGEEIAELLNQVQVRNGIRPTKGHVWPEHGWVKLNHFEAEKLVNLAEQQNEEPDNGLRM